MFPGDRKPTVESMLNMFFQDKIGKFCVFHYVQYNVPLCYLVVLHMFEEISMVSLCYLNFTKFPLIKVKYNFRLRIFLSKLFFFKN